MNITYNEIKDYLNSKNLLISGDELYDRYISAWSLYFDDKLTDFDDLLSKEFYNRYMNNELALNFSLPDGLYIKNNSIFKHANGATKNNLQINTACLMDNCKYIVKKIGSEFKNRLYEELKISKLASDFGLGPQIYDYKFDGYFLEIYMENADGLISELYNNPQLREYKQNISNQIRLLIKILGTINIFHADIHEQNIMYSKHNDGYKILIIDYGLSRLKRPQDPTYPDLRSVEGIILKYQN